MRKIALFLAGTVLCGAFAQAHRVEPIRFDLAPSGAGAQTSIRVVNTRSFPITIETVPSRLAIAEDGAETLSPAEDDFLIFPQQAVIQPGKVQAFRVRYIGSPTLATSQAYRIGVNQLPIDMREKGETGVAVVVNFATLANIVPPGARSDVIAESIGQGDEGRLAVKLHNRGTRYARLSDMEMTVEQAGRRKSFRPADTKDWFSSNLVLPGQRLRVSMPIPAGFTSNGLAISFRQAA